MGKKKKHGKGGKHGIIRPPEPLDLLGMKLWLMMPSRKLFDTCCENGIQTSIALNGVLGHEKMTRDGLMDLESKVYDKIMPALKYAMASKRLDPALDIYLDENVASGNKSNNPDIDARAKFSRECDVIDFSEYARTHDVYAEAAKRIEKLANENDVSYLWSTNEYVRIKIGDGLEYEIKREGYDTENHTIRYEIRIYETYKLFGNKNITAPTMIMRGCVAFLSLHEIEAIIDLALSTYDVMHPEAKELKGSGIDIFRTTLEKNRELVDIMKADIIKDLILDNEDDVDIQVDLSKILMPVFVMEKGLYAAHISEHARKYINSRPPAPKPDEIEPLIREASTKSVSNLLLGSYMDMGNKIGLIGADGEIVTGDLELSRTIMLHTIQKATAPFAYIILVNAMIADKKASKPIRETPKPVTKLSATPQEIETDGNNKSNQDADTSTTAVRKIRILDGVIPISSSATRLSSPSMRKIATYTISEWGRKGHLRHYKNGKTVEIKPTTVKRRKLNDGGTKAKTGTDYVIKSDKDKNP